jgi:hypothetical protein
MLEHRGNGEHPEAQARRRRLLLLSSLVVLSAIGELLGLVRLAGDLLLGAPRGAIVYQLVLLLVNAVFGLLVLLRIRALLRR